MENEKMQEQITQIDKDLTRHDVEIKSIERRMEAVEHNQTSIQKLTISVSELAQNMKYMLEEQKKQGGKIERLEQAPADDFKHYKRLTVGYLITSIVSALLGAFMAIVLK